MAVRRQSKRNYLKRVIATAMLVVTALPASSAEIRLAFAISDDIFLAPVFAAEQLGYYRAADIEIRRLNLRGAVAIQEALRAGQADIIDASGPAAAQAFPAGNGGKLIAASANGFYGWTVIARNGGPQSIRELSGRMIGISSTHSLSDMAALLAADQNNMQFEIVMRGAGSIVPELRDGKLDAVLSSALLGLREVSAGRAQIMFNLGVDHGQYLVSGYAASTNMIENRQRDLRAFLNATFQALVYMKANRKWSTDLLKEYARISDNNYAELLHDNVIRAMSADPEIDPSSLKAAMMLAARAWNQPELASLDAAALYTNEFVTIPATLRSP